MGIVYTPVAGFTVDVPEELRNRMVEDGDEIDSWEDWLDAEGIEYAMIGSSYTGETETIPLLRPVDGIEVDQQISDWLETLNDALGTELTAKNVRFTVDTYVC